MSKAQRMIGPYNLETSDGGLKMSDSMLFSYQIRFVNVG